MATVMFRYLEKGGVYARAIVKLPFPPHEPPAHPQMRCTNDFLFKLAGMKRLSAHLCPCALQSLFPHCLVIAF